MASEQQPDKRQAKRSGKTAEPQPGWPDARARAERAERHVYGPRQVAALLPALTRPVFSRRPPAQAQIMLDWPEIMGPALAETTQPRRLSAGTLTIACPGPIALELQHLAGVLIERINRHVGHEIVQRLRFVQDSGMAPALPTPRPPTRVARAQVERHLDGLEDGSLKDALRALGLAVLGET